MQMIERPAAVVERHIWHSVSRPKASDDGIISTASLIVGVAFAGAARGEILTAAVAGWAAGEYVSVSSQSDSEAADLDRAAEGGVRWASKSVRPCNS